MEDVQTDSFDQKDFSRVREILGLNVECVDPYGYWQIQWKKKTKAPSELLGFFTDLHAATRAIELYNSNQVTRAT